MSLNLKQPLVSVCIATYNRPEGLHRTLKCITGQTYKNIEIIISDDHSPEEETKRIVQEFMKNDPKIRFYRQKKNLGEHLNNIFLLEKVVGEYSMLACDDDEWEPGFIEECMRAFDESTILVFPHSRTHYRKQGTFRYHVMPELSRNKSKFENFVALYDNLVVNIFYGIHRTDSLRQAVKHGENYDFIDICWLTKILLRGNIVIVDKLLFTAGIDDCEYEIKPAKVYKNRDFDYSTCLFALLRLINGSSFRLKEKMNACRIILIMFCRNYLWHEHQHAADTLKNKLKYLSVGLTLFIMRPTISYCRNVVLRAVSLPLTILNWLIRMFQKTVRNQNV